MSDVQKFIEDDTQHEWHAQELTAESVKVVDPGEGSAVVLRHFFFKAQPLQEGQEKPDKHEIVAHFKKLIETTLWGDGLVIREDKPLEVHTIQKAKKISPALYAKMQQEGADFVILCMATPKKGVTVVDTFKKL